MEFATFTTVDAVMSQMAQQLLYKVIQTLPLAIKPKYTDHDATAASVVNIVVT